MKKLKFLIIILCCICLVGCKKNKDNEIEVTPTETPTTSPTPTETPTPSATPTLSPEELHEGQVRSQLTGEWIPEELGNLRPYAIMINNLKLVNPQSGIGEADVLYEAITEGGITRLLGIYGDLYDEKGDLLSRIGSVRSARHYFVSFADEYDSIYVHYGETKYATSKLKELKVNNLSGLEGVGNTVFYRDNSIQAPHNAFASGEGILKGTEMKGYETELREDYTSPFQFYEEDTELESDEEVNKLTLKFSSYTSPYFEYNKDSKLYERYQFGGPHIDANTKKQLAFKNIMVLYVKEWDIDRNDYQTMDIENSKGNGYYITNGKAVPIQWKKNESKSEMNYYDEQGNELYMNPGKTYLAIFPNDRENDVVFE